MKEFVKWLGDREVKGFDELLELAKKFKFDSYKTGYDKGIDDFTEKLKSFHVALWCCKSPKQLEDMIEAIAEQLKGENTND